MPVERPSGRKGAEAALTLDHVDGAGLPRATARRTPRALAEGTCEGKLVPQTVATASAWTASISNPNSGIAGAKAATSARPGASLPAARASSSTATSGPPSLDPSASARIRAIGAAIAAEGMAISAAAVATGAATSSVVLDHYGDVLFALKRPADAIAAWQKALAGDRNDVDPAQIEKKIALAKSSR